MPDESPDDEGSEPGPVPRQTPLEDTRRIRGALAGSDVARYALGVDEQPEPQPGSADLGENGRPAAEPHVTEPWTVPDPPSGQQPTAPGPSPETIERHDIGQPGAAVRVVARPVTVDPEMDDIAVNTTTIDLADGCRVELRAASVRGRSHQHYRKPRQDDHTFRVVDDRFLVAAVADGVSAGTRSAVAARTVVHAVCDRLTGLLDSTEPGALPWPELMEELCDRIAERCAEVLDREVMSREEASEAMATTVAVAVVDLRRPAEDLPLHVARLGDTTVARLTASGSWTVLLAGKSGSDGPASSVTAALPRQGAAGVCNGVGLLGRDEALVLLTDGLGDPLGDGSNDVGTWLAEHWRTPPTPLQFAAHADFARRSFDDDRTALVVWRGTTPTRRGR